MAEDRALLSAGLANERAFVLTLGGFAVEIAGATLVTHERIPVPRFNFVDVSGVSAERQTAFFERALDHYFQRALRPAFRVGLPVPAHLDRGLRRFGFLPRRDPVVPMVAEEPVGPGERGGARVRPAVREELDRVAAFWTSERERPEFRAALDIAWAHPNPDERLVPLLGSVSGHDVAAGLVYRSGRSAGFYAISTLPEGRGQGAASSVVSFALRHTPAGPVDHGFLFADSTRLERRLVKLGFRPLGRMRQYELPPETELSMPPSPPSGPPRWRPPRTPPSGSAGDRAVGPGG
ncbi:MAG TPA: hypothetical protein VMG81_05270 [Thermoplasmata archaeon]|nr:hypothetical protein [Thermoplasmata archaeon]